MAAEGPNSPSTMADDDTVGTITWSDLDNAKTSNNAYALGMGATNADTHYLKATNFGFSIPSGATIDGIKIEIERQRLDGDGTIDNEVKIVKSNGTIGAENKNSLTPWTTDSDTYYTYGAVDDLWSENWSDIDINHANFGVVLSASLDPGKIYGEITLVDHIRITVYYTEGAPPLVEDVAVFMGANF